MYCACVNWRLWLDDVWLDLSSLLLLHTLLQSQTWNCVRMSDWNSWIFSENHHQRQQCLNIRESIIGWRKNEVSWLIPWLASRRASSHMKMLHWLPFGIKVATSWLRFAWKMTEKLVCVGVRVCVHNWAGCVWLVRQPDLSVSHMRVQFIALFFLLSWCSLTSWWW